jgi:hypothetical protein
MTLLPSLFQGARRYAAVGIGVGGRHGDDLHAVWELPRRLKGRRGLIAGH